MKVCHPSENFTSLKTLILQLQLTLELSRTQEILSIYTNFLLLFAEYPSLFNFFFNNFISQAPERDGGNWYGYAGQNLVRNIDPTGLVYYDQDGVHSSNEAPIPHKSTGQGEGQTPKVPDASDTTPTNKYWSEEEKRNKHNKSDKSNIEFPPGTKVTVETSGLDFNILTIFNLLSKGGLITIQGGFFDAKFTVDTGDGHVYNFTARYRYSVTQKDGCELTALGTSLTAGKASKVLNSTENIFQIAKDFETAGTDSFAIGLSVGFGGGASGSNSGNWDFGQFSIGSGISIKGLPSLPGSSTWSHTETKLNEKSIVEYGYDMWSSYEY